MTKSTTSNPTANTDRETDGRFAKEDILGGPGNPFARKTAALRQALLNAVTPRDITNIVTLLLFNAKSGHLPSVKMLFQYVIGKPKLVVEPDTLDLDELKLLQASQMPSEALKEFTNKFPPSLALDTLRGLRIAIDLQLRQMLGETTPPPADEVQEEQQPAARSAKTGQAPSPNGKISGSEDDEDDDEMDWDDDAPSTNGVFQALKELKSILPPFKTGRRG